MNLDGAEITPAEDMLAVVFVDDCDEDDTQSTSYSVPSTPDGSMDYEGCLAVVHAVGPKCKQKVGQIVVTREWARSGIKVGECILINKWEVVATLKSPA